MWNNQSNTFLLLIWLVALLGCSSPDDKSITLEKKKTPQLGNVSKIPDETIKQLEGLGYFDRAKTSYPGKLDVTKVELAAFDGFNLYSSRHVAKAYLIDNNGKMLHEWSAKLQTPAWMHTELLPNGDLLAISKLAYVARYDWDSNLIWKKKLGAHHDLAIDSKDNLSVLTSSIRKYNHNGARIPVLDNAIALLSKDGKLLSKTQLFPFLGKSILPKRLNRIRWKTAKGYTSREIYRENTITDVFHTNSIQIISTPIPSIAPVGSFLLSVRELNQIVILDESLTKKLWSWGEGELEEQHHATLLNNGNIMVFDNGVQREQSRVIEVNPVTEKIEWSYSAKNFYTKLRGAAQKLPNNNVLITESDKGHVFEVTHDGKIVWEFWNPDVFGDENPTRAVIYRMRRYESNYLKNGLLDNAAIQ